MSDYITAEDLKGSLELTNTANLDRDIERAIPAASRAIDELCGRKFWRDSAAVDRFYAPSSPSVCFIDDAEDDDAISVTIDRAGSYSYGEAWVEGTDYILEPMNGPADGKPYESIRAIRNGFPCRAGAVKVNAQFGRSEVPAQVREACAILANKLLVRTRQAPFGIVSAGIDTGAVMRIARNDPDVMGLLEPFMRNRPFA